MAIKIIETPRDAMQGIATFIPTEQKIDYINSLLSVGFDELDFGSFVSPKAIPQLRDSGEVFKNLDLQNNATKIMATIGNYRGAEEALKYDGIDSVSFPFSISQIFLERNIRSSFEKGMNSIKEIVELCSPKNKDVVIYITMAFGNPYGEDWSVNLLGDWVGKLKDEGIKTIILGDTTGEGSCNRIADGFSITKEFSDLDIGVHLHTTVDDWRDKLSAAYESGCKRFDGAIGGFGGCPLSGKALTGNLPTEFLIEYLESQGEKLNINKEAFYAAQAKAAFTFPK